MDKKCFRAHVFFLKRINIFVVVKAKTSESRKNYMINYVHTIYWMKIKTILSPIYILWQEVIKVREWIPHIGPLTKVIRLKLSLDVVPSSSEYITHAMRGQPKQLSRTTWEKKGRESHFVCFGFVSYRGCFLHSQPPFCAVGHFICFSARLAVYSVLGSWIKQTSTATARATATATSAIAV